MQRSKEHNFLGIFTTHWHGLRNRHKIPRGSSNSTESNGSKCEQGQSADAFLWDRCFEVCKNTHAESLPCLTLADFNVFLTSNTQNFVTKGCGALDLYNELFGKPNLEILSIVQDDKSSSSSRAARSRNSGRSTLGSCDIGSFLDETYVSKVVECVANFLQSDFENPLIPVYCVSSRKKEAYVSIQCYLCEVDYICLSIPAFLISLKLTMERTEELKLQIYTEDSTWVSQELKDEVDDIVTNFQSISQTLTLILHMIDSGSVLITILSAWANYEFPLAEVLVVMKRRHNALLNISPFDKISEIRKLCDYISLSVRALTETANAFEEFSSDTASIYPASDPSSRNSELVYSGIGPSIVELSRHSPASASGTLEYRESAWSA